MYTVLEFIVKTLKFIFFATAGIILLGLGLILAIATTVFVLYVAPILISIIYLLIAAS
jgi:hypothetical protein